MMLNIILRKLPSLHGEFFVMKCFSAIVGNFQIVFLKLQIQLHWIMFMCRF